MRMYKQIRKLRLQLHLNYMLKIETVTKSS